MSYSGVIFAGPLGGVNAAATASLNILGPLLAQVDFALFGSLGIGTLKANLQAQLTAALKAQLNLGIGISNPFVGFQLALGGIAALQAQIAAALAGALPAVSIEASAQISAVAAFAGVLSAQIGGLEALIQASLAVKVPAVSFLAGLNLSVGPVMALAWSDITLAQAGSALYNDFNAGLSFGPSSIGPGEQTYGVLLLTKSPQAWVGLQATLLAA